LANRVHVAPMGASDQIGVTRNCHVAPSPTEYNENVGKRIQITSVKSRQEDDGRAHERDDRTGD
jgi:hypothetical protein